MRSKRREDYLKCVHVLRLKSGFSTMSSAYILGATKSEGVPTAEIDRSCGAAACPKDNLTGLSGRMSERSYAVDALCVAAWGQ